jgi:membrane fusion protein (multidrug efflux system)
MPTAFNRTFRSLDADGARWTICGIVAAAAIAGGCAWWSTRTPVTLYAATAAARIEVDSAVYPVASPLAGRVTVARLAIGREVQEGEVLVELDSAAEQFQIREELSRAAGLRAGIEALRRQVAAEEQARENERVAGKFGHEESRADAREADAAAAHAESEERRVRQLLKEGLIAEREYQSAASEAKRLRAAADSKRIAVDRSGQEQVTHDSDRAVQLQNLAAQIANLQVQLPIVEATVERLKNEIERRRVRAPMSGKLGEAAVLRPGAVVKEGDKLGAIVPTGRLRAVAQFPADAALGRIRAGQPARLRLDGFPWIEYGTLGARVAAVAGEVRDGTVRVEFAIDRNSNSRIPLQHGLPGSVEIEVERTTPWTLVMRHAGRKWGEAY